MVVLDADSVMSGRCLVELMRLMEAHPDAGIIQTAPLAFGRETLVRAHPAVRDARVRSAVRRGPALLAARRIALLGPQRDPARRAFHEALRARPLAGPRRAVRRDPLARFRRSRADAPRRLGRLDRVRPARQLRGNAAEPARRAQARPALVPRQPDQLAAFLRARPASGASRGVRDRRDGVSLGAALVPVPRAVDRAARGAYADRADLFRHAEPAFSALARMASGARARPLHGDGDAAVPAEDAQRRADRAARRAAFRRRAPARRRRR